MSQPQEHSIALIENGLTDSRCDTRGTRWPSIATRFISPEMKTRPHRNLMMNVHGGSIPKRQKVETAVMSIRQRAENKLCLSRQRESRSASNVLTPASPMFPESKVLAPQRFLEAQDQAVLCSSPQAEQTCPRSSLLEIQAVWGRFYKTPFQAVLTKCPLQPPGALRCICVSACVSTVTCFTQNSKIQAELSENTTQ